MLAVSTILMKLLMIFSYFTDGFAYAGEALTGRFVGERSGDGIKSTVSQTFIWSIGVAALFMLVYGLGGVPLFRLMTSDPAVVDYPEDELRAMGFDPHKGEGTDVLFVEDPRQKGYWHPRISANNTKLYASLPEWQQKRFDQLHEDFFWRRHNQFWKDSAMRKLPALLHSTGMLCCGEDLGMIPPCVPEVMEDQNILSLEIQRGVP